MYGQRFYNLTSDEVSVEVPLPVFSYTYDLPDNYQDSVYSVSIDYPEFIDVSSKDTAALLAHTELVMGEMPEIEYHYSVDKKKAKLSVVFFPFVKRDGRYQKLVSFMLRLTAVAVNKTSSSKKLMASSKANVTRAASSSTYASSSVLSSGNWVKIYVSNSGVHQITADLVKKAGFSSIDSVKIYGYGGARQQEVLTQDYLASTDDLLEVPQCVVGGRHLFYAQGPVSWESDDATTRTRNPYSSYGYYFMTEGKPTTVDSASFVSSFYPSADDYHSLYEVDNYAWYEGGCNLFDSQLLELKKSYDYTLSGSADSISGKLTVVITSDAASVIAVSINGDSLGTVTTPKISSDGYTLASSKMVTFDIDGHIAKTNTVTLKPLSGGNIRLDYLSLYYEQPDSLPNLTGTSFSAPLLAYGITNQNLHADENIDMVIIIPASQLLLEQAERLAQLHRDEDGMTVKIVPADELYNEFSSGTPDANAYRRYMKMLYDKAGDDEDAMPKYLVLFGDGTFDNRMLTSSWANADLNDYLLCYESENSFSKTACYVDDGYFCYLDDGEGANHLTTDKPDVAVGRFPASTASEAKIMVDKTINYRKNQSAGSWQTKVCILGDDGISTDSKLSVHMEAAETVAEMIEESHPELIVKRYMWDAYTMTTSSTGNRYPELQKALQQQMEEGALMFNYSGHGAPASLSHEYVLTTSDFNASTTGSDSYLPLPLWVTASCDIMPFDGSQENIGETAMLNSNGGAIAFYGTTRTVYSSYNLSMEKAFTKYLFSPDTHYSIGEAVRLAKNDLVSSSTDRTANKLQYSLLGDPALKLAYPDWEIKIDSINGTVLSDTIQLKSGSAATVYGHLESDGSVLSSFNGQLTATVRDAKQTVVCKNNQTWYTGDPFTYEDRSTVIYSGSDSVKSGLFSFTFTVPMDISYSDSTGSINVYATNNDGSVTAAGYTENVVFNGSVQNTTDSIGPSIYCYLNTTDFVNGGVVNSTPFFGARVYDESGINTSEAGLGHNMQLIIDGSSSLTYDLNSYFTFNDGSYQGGTVAFGDIDELSDGHHTLKFRAWDIYNNSSTAELDFYVDSSLSPDIISVDCTPNPASNSATFIIVHSMPQTSVDVTIDIYDMSGRMIHQLNSSNVSGSSTISITWDLCTGGGAHLQTSVYLYRVRLTTSEGTTSSKSNKLVVTYNN